MLPRCNVLTFRWHTGSWAWGRVILLRGKTLDSAVTGRSTYQHFKEKRCWEMFSPWRAMMTKPSPCLNKRPTKTSCGSGVGLFIPAVEDNESTSGQNAKACFEFSKLLDWMVGNFREEEMNSRHREHRRRHDLNSPQMKIMIEKDKHQIDPRRCSSIIVLIAVSAYHSPSIPLSWSELL